MVRMCWKWKPEERAAVGLFLAMQYPIEIPGVSNMTFLKTALNASGSRAMKERSRPLIS